ncbi:VacJ family lipoprotein [Alteromonas sediminis]|uniref:VacJ family lipoprotein n=2 Tax=Alteromonas sediminis TaxID=2259342 RepID=A0A3N5Y3Y8_9ALTE|nr:VacJ family lipoprotein [Alteromonas sediminis]
MGLGGCAANTAEQQAAATQNQASESDPRDPLEPVNRVIWDINWDILDKYLLRPASVAYTTVMPDFARTGLLNAAENLEEPGNMVNNFLQGKGEAGFTSLSRFLLNSTFGVFGLFDVATNVGLTVEDEDFDEVLGVWGIENGPFLMLPAAGPNDVRGVVGGVVDNTYYPMAILNSNFTLARWLITTLETRASLIAQEEQIKSSPDSYAFIKNAYFQNKLFQVTDGKIQEPAIDDAQLDDFEEFESMLDDIDTSKEEKKNNK